MRSLFLQYHSQLQDGFYIFVAKQKMVENDFDMIKKDFLRVLKRASVLKRK